MVLIVLVAGWAVLATAARSSAEADSAGAFSIPFTNDSGGQPLEGAHRYTLAFGPDRLPPAKADWSLTMYGLPDQQLVENSIDRYWISSRMLPRLKRDADGGLTLYIQKNAPGEGKNANWLPAPDGPFLMILRLYQPEQAVLDNAWEAPPVVRVE